MCVCVYVLEILWQPGVGIQGNIFLVIFFIIFSSFCIFVPHPLAAPASSLFLHLFFIFPSFLGRWGLEAEARLFILFSFFFSVFLHFFFICVGGPGQKGGGQGEGVGGGRGRGGGPNRGAFSFYFPFFFIVFSFFLHFMFICSSFFLHLCHHFFLIFEVSQPQIFIFSSFFLHFSSRRP